VLDSRHADELVQALVRALDFDEQAGPVRQLARTNLVVGVVKDHLDDRQREPEVRLRRTIEALADVATGSADETVMWAAELLWRTRRG
jgi:hypothetical protein